MTLTELIQNFQMFTDWEDKYRYLIELGDQLAPFAEEDKTDANKVEGCQSQVWMTHYQKDGKHYFNATSDAHIVRGLQMILLTCVNGQNTQEIRALDIPQIFHQMGLDEHLSPSRRNGLFSMINRIVSLML